MAYQHLVKVRCAQLIVYAICLGLQRGDASAVYGSAVARIRQIDQVESFSWSDVFGTANSVWGDVRAPKRWDWRLFVQRLSDGPVNAAVVFVGSAIAIYLFTLLVTGSIPLSVFAGLLAGVLAIAARAAFMLRRLARYDEDNDYRNRWRQPSSRLMTFANVVSASRLLLAIAVWWSLASALPETAAIAVAAMMATDVLDGYLARRFDQVTDFGAALDPAMNRISCAIVLMLATAYMDLPPFASIAAGLVAAREVVVFGGGLVLVTARMSLPPVSLLGKLSSTFIWLQVILIYVQPFVEGRRWNLSPIPLAAVSAAAVVLSWTSAFGYWSMIRQESSPDPPTRRPIGPGDPYSIHGVLGMLESSPLNATLVNVYVDAVSRSPSVSDPLELVDMSLLVVRSRQTNSGGVREEHEENLLRVREVITEARSA